MAETIDERRLLRNCNSGAEMTALDGKVGAILEDGRFFITSPNQTTIFRPPSGDRQVRLRADSRYGDDDPTLWPQPYFTHICHYGAIPRPDSLPVHEIIWWQPTREYFTLPNETVPVRGLGKLSINIVGELQSSIRYLLGRVKKYESASLPNRRPPSLAPTVKGLEHAMARLESAYTTFRQMEFAVREVQRSWLQIYALLEYMEVYKPRMDGHAVPATQVAETVGIFTSDVRVAQDFFVAGLPCWLIRPASAFASQNIWKIVSFLSPEDHLILAPHRYNYPVIYSGPSSSPEKFARIDINGRHSLRYPDFFAASGNSQPASPTPSSAPATSAAGPSHVIQSANRHQPTRRNQNRKQDGRPKRQQATGPPSRNKFQPITGSPVAPLPIACWVSALEAVDTNPERVDPRYRSPDDRKYLFPEPGIIIAANEMRRARYLTTWKAIEPACIYRLYLPSFTALPLSNQEWRDILIGDISSKSSGSRSAKAREHARQLLGSALDDLDIGLHDPSPSAAEPSPITDSEAQRILWQLTEINFRFEFLALDKRASNSCQSEDERQELIRECFGGQALLCADVEQANTGLALEDWCGRLPVLHRFRRLMRDWEGPKPAPLLEEDRQSVEEYQEAEVLELENAVAQYYTDSFFRFFGRAAIIPTRLP